MPDSSPKNIATESELFSILWTEPQRFVEIIGGNDSQLISTVTDSKFYKKMMKIFASADQEEILEMFTDDIEDIVANEKKEKQKSKLVATCALFILNQEKLSELGIEAPPMISIALNRDGDEIGQEESKVPAIQQLLDHSCTDAKNQKKLVTIQEIF